MFRFTATFLVIFMVVNHEFAATSRVDFAHQLPEMKKRSVPEYDQQAVERNSVVDFQVNESAVDGHSRQKRRVDKLALGIKALSFGSKAAFLGSTVTTVYYAIRKCEDHRPRNCGDRPTCHYIHPCPDICHGPFTLRKYVERQRKAIKEKLVKMDNIQRDAFNYATKAITAGQNNRLIFIEIKRINQKVNQLILSLAQLDVNLAERFRNNSVRIKGLIRNQLLSLDKIVSSTEIGSMFDEWTWEGTGAFVFSLAVPLGLKTYQYFQKRYAINKIYKDLKVNFEARFVNNPRLGKKFGMTTENLNQELKDTARSVYKSHKSLAKVSTFEKAVNNFIAPLIDAMVIALSIWTTYEQVNRCFEIADDMHDTAKEMTEKADEIERIKHTLVDPLLKNVTTKAWPRVREKMTNQTTLDWLEEIRNLTLGANKPNVTTAETIQHFIDNIKSAKYSDFLELQKKLISALISVEFEYSCLADKQHAITTVIMDCRKGREPFPELYRYATTKHKLNRGACIAKGVMPYTSQDQFFVILNATATHQGWYNNCLLNSESLLYRVCSEKIKGYNTPQEIVAQVNQTALTEDMVSNFLGRCPPPKITPKSIIDTCKLYCLYQPVSVIAKAAVLLESQVLQIQRTCPICNVKTRDIKRICKLHYCQGQNSTTIEKQIELPLPTVNFVIASNCSNGCAIEDPVLKRSICRDYRCRYRTVTQIASRIGFPVSSVRNVLPECHTTVCVVTPKGTSDTCKLYCLYLPVSRIARTVSLLESQVVQIQRTCPICRVNARDLETICSAHYCHGKDATTIEKQVELPLPTVKFTIANNCSNGCVIEDPVVTRSICNDHKCRHLTATQIASNIGLPESSVRNVLPKCSTTTCRVSDGDRIKVLNLHCKFGASAATMHSLGLVNLPVDVIQGIINSKTCAEFLKTNNSG